MLRFFDFIFSLFGIIVSIPIFAFILVVGIFDTGSPLFFQKRVGRNKKSFTLIKFRTMKKDTKNVASHLVPISSITKTGKFLRKTKLDELPQLLNVLKGDMSLVGPRPSLFEQTDLIAAREKLGIFNVRPGITGLAQIKKIDMSTPEILAKTDKEMIDGLNLKLYLKYILFTILGSGQGDAAK